jgi:hypothetical protein
MAVKAILFVVIGVLAGLLILFESPTLRTAALLVLVAWSFARAYYFLFYVIQHYIDPTYKFAGLWSVARYLASRLRPSQKS